jgi:hypothetical protein
MRGLTLVAALLVTSCIPAPPPPTSRLVTSPTAAPVAAPVTEMVATKSEPAPPSVPSLDWPRVPTTRIALHQNIWIETARTPQDAAALTIGNSLAILGGSVNPPALLPAALPKQPVVAWQRRDAVPLRVVMDMDVVLTSGYLEHLLSRSEAGKDHESILSTPFDAEHLKTALIAIGLTPGKPATFVKEVNGERVYDFKPATGDVVKIYLQYEDPKGNTVTVPAQSWVASTKDGKPLTADWVFAGSYRGKSKTFQGEEFEYFGANDGRVVCVTNYGSALLDLPFESHDADPQGNALGYQANTAAIPMQGTKVRVLFEPKADAKAAR